MKVGSHLLACAPAWLWETDSALLEESVAPNSLAQRSPPGQGLTPWTQADALGVPLSLSPLFSSCLLSILIWDQVSAYFWLWWCSPASSTVLWSRGHHSGIGANGGLRWACIAPLGRLTPEPEFRGLGDSWLCRSAWCKFLICWPLWLLSVFPWACSSGQLVARRAEHGGSGETPCSSRHSCLLHSSRGSRSKLRSKGNTESGCSKSSSSWNKGWHRPSDMDRKPQEW